MPGLIEDYAIIGNCESAALVGRDGSIDWLALPRFNSAACFAALLGDAANGRWQISPKGDARITRRYRDGTLVLEAPPPRVPCLKRSTSLPPNMRNRAPTGRTP